MRFKDYMIPYKIFVDMDGVLCDFSGRYKDLFNEEFESVKKPWPKINSKGMSFWSEMAWTSDGKQLWKALKTHKPTILSSPGLDIGGISEGKKEWLTKHLPGIKYILERQKHLYAGKNKILIDDTADKIDKWTAAGGIGILHKNTKTTLQKLNKYLKG